MNLYQIREAIDNEMRQANPNEARITELIQERDRLRAGEPPAARLTPSEFHERMLQATHG